MTSIMRMRYTQVSMEDIPPGVNGQSVLQHAVVVHGLIPEPAPILRQRTKENHAKNKRILDLRWSQKLVILRNAVSSANL